MRTRTRTRSAQTAQPTQHIGNDLWVPQVEVLQRGDDLVVYADLPGVSREDVHVELADGVLEVCVHAPRARQSPQQPEEREQVPVK